MQNKMRNKAINSMNNLIWRARQIEMKTIIQKQLATFNLKIILKLLMILIEKARINLKNKILIQQKRKKKIVL